MHCALVNVQDPSFMSRWAFALLWEPWLSWSLIRLGCMAVFPGVLIRPPSGVKPGFHYLPGW